MNTQATAKSRDLAGFKVGIIGLCGNLLLVILKLLTGYVSNSIAITADALNNLTDCASSLLTLFGFKMTSRGKDWMHPYGHGRIEYICGFLISIFIMATAVSVVKDSIGRLLSPEEIHISLAVIMTLASSIVIKLLMAWHVYSTNKTIASPTLKAVRNDDLSDSLVTLVTMLGILIGPLTGVPVDGFLGILVALMILWSGMSSFMENFTLLLGEGVTPETDGQIRQVMSDYEIFNNIEAVAMHDYGPEEKLAFIKVSLCKSPHSSEARNILELVKKRLKDELKIDATIYWDTIETNDSNRGKAYEEQNDIC